MTRLLSRQALIDPNSAARVSDRGIDWYVSRFGMVRADLIKPYEPKEPLPAKPYRVRMLLDAFGRDEGVTLVPQGRLRDRATGERYAVLLRAPRYLHAAVNAGAWDAWAAREWHRVSLGERGAVRFHELRRGRPVLAGFVLTLRPWNGANLVDLDGAA